MADEARDIEKAILYVSILTLIAYVGFELYKFYADQQAVSDASQTAPMPASPDPLVAALGSISNLGQGPSWLVYNTPASYQMGPPVVNTTQPLPKTSTKPIINCPACATIGK